MKNLMLAIFGSAVMAWALMAAPSMASSNPSAITNQACKQLEKGGQVSGCTTEQSTLNNKDGNDSLVKKILDVVLYAAGIISFIFVIIGGIRYITSTGDPGRTQSAKETLLYAIIGLIVTFMAIPITEYVLTKAGG